MQVSETRVIAAEPEAVWAIGGDTAKVADWIPAIAESWQREDLRHIIFVDGGGEATERIVEHDGKQRRYVYEYVSGPLPLRSYRSTFAVVEHPEGAEVVWSAEFEGPSAEEDTALAQTITEIYRGALDGLTKSVAAQQH
ncbi:SRPBCC family protein [Rhodococcus sp. 14C212]|uniref:SRPBCC family protein n=1 Tax=Rhodococcus sp. 14C212 TaxID=2711209 RepID=UPI0013ED4652|nr:SRPBCC family protein [Rhodococcus sp. 14C212]NGP08100.1 SRPBCC family protein [Rhodococcus sp. 14C212]